MKRIRRIGWSLLLLAAAACTESDPQGAVSPPLPPDPPEPPTPPAATYRIGDLYKVGSVEGIVYKVDETGGHGMILSLDETLCIWSSELEDLSWRFGNFSFTEGYYNVECIKQIDNWGKKYPAVKWCDAKNALSLTAWYLPALYELGDVFAAFNGGPAEGGDDDGTDPVAEKGREAQERFNKALTDAGGTPLSIDDYWSSTQFGAQDTYSYSFLHGDYARYDTYKGGEHLVRAVRRF